MSSSVLDGARERGPFAGEGGKTGADFERAVLADGTPVVIKHVSPDGEPGPRHPGPGTRRSRLVDRSCPPGPRDVVAGLSGYDPRVPARDMSSTKDLVFALPDIARLLWRVVRDQRVPRLVRGGLIGLGAYLALPFDVVPDWIPLLGQLDDVVVITVGVRTLLRRVPEPILHEHWSGERRVLETLLGRSVIDSTTNGG